MNFWNKMTNAGKIASAVATFVAVVIGIAVSWKALTAPAPADDRLERGPVNQLSYENCRELPKSQGDRLLEMVSEGTITSVEAGELARSLACSAYKQSEEKAQATNVAYAYQMQSSLSFLLTSHDRDVREATAYAIRSGFDEAALQHLFNVTEPPEPEPGLGPEIPSDAEPGYAQAASVSEQDIANNLRIAVVALR